MPVISSNSTVSQLSSQFTDTSAAPSSNKGKGKNTGAQAQGKAASASVWNEASAKLDQPKGKKPGFFSRLMAKPTVNTTGAGLPEGSKIRKPALQKSPPQLSQNMRDCKELHALLKGRDGRLAAPPEGAAADALSRMMESSAGHSGAASAAGQAGGFELPPSLRLLTGLLGPDHPIEGLHVLQDVCETEAQSLPAGSSKHEQDKAKQDIAERLVGGLAAHQKLDLREALSSANMNSIAESLMNQAETLSVAGNEAQMSRSMEVLQWAELVKNAVDKELPGFTESTTAGPDAAGKLPAVKLGLSPIKIDSKLSKEIASGIDYTAKQIASSTSTEDMLQDMCEREEGLTTSRDEILSKMESAEFGKEKLKNISEDGKVLKFHFESETLTFSNRGCGNMEFRGSNLKATAEETDFSSLRELMETGKQKWIDIATRNAAVVNIFNMAQGLGTNSVREVRDVATAFMDSKKDMLDSHGIDRQEVMSSLVKLQHKAEA